MERMIVLPVYHYPVCTIKQSLVVISVSSGLRPYSIFLLTIYIQCHRQCQCRKSWTLYVARCRLWVHVALWGAKPGVSLWGVTRSGPGRQISTLYTFYIHIIICPMCDQSPLHYFPPLPGNSSFVWALPFTPLAYSSLAILSGSLGGIHCFSGETKWEVTVLCSLSHSVWLYSNHFYATLTIHTPQLFLSSVVLCFLVL